MTYLTAILLGLVQGITEFLPVSSSGHLAILQNIFHVEGADLMFDVMLHVGTLFAIFIVYYRDVRGVIRGGLSLVGLGKDRGRTSPAARQRRHLAVFIIIGTLPLLLVLPFKSRIEALSGNTVFVGMMLLVTGLILYLADRYGRARKTEQQISILDILLVGLGQALAVVPGISRSGTTISTGMLRGFQRTFAVKFSFLLSIPAVLGAALLNIVEAIKLGFDPGLLPAYFVGMLAAAVSGYFSIRFIRWTAARSKFGGFAYYCWGAGIIALLLSLVA
ncbi:MAG: undecaprenyl-diphosphate phosphatase [Oscillospiraceae bacterium]|nr:undecaprenyl-diphosphate phosphatase [Oscillospiraceae bacterium]